MQKLAMDEVQLVSGARFLRSNGLLAAKFAAPLSVPTTVMAALWGPTDPVRFAVNVGTNFGGAQDILREFDL